MHRQHYDTACNKRRSCSRDVGPFLICSIFIFKKKNSFKNFVSNFFFQKKSLKFRAISNENGWTTWKKKFQKISSTINQNMSIIPSPLKKLFKFGASKMAGKQMKKKNVFRVFHIWRMKCWHFDKTSINQIGPRVPPGGLWSTKTEKHKVRGPRKRICCVIGA